MSDPTFKVGDVVHLRSGGPALTVAEIVGIWVGCAWFKEDGSADQAQFHAAMLKAGAP